MDPLPLAVLAVLVVVLVLAFALRGPLPSRGSFAAGGPRGGFRPLWRKLWYDHVAWTRLYIISRLAELPDQSVALQRLLQNQQDLGRAVGVLKGTAAGQRAAGLFTEHIEIGGKVIEAAVSADAGALERESAAWRRNAADIARFFASATPLPEAGVYAHMEKHLQLTTQEVVLRLEKKWEADVVNFDAIVAQALGMADYFAGGLA